jgi:hypothetical protein
MTRSRGFPRDPPVYLKMRASPYISLSSKFVGRHQTNQRRYESATGIPFIHLTIMRNTKGGNTDIRCYIVRLPEAISLKLQESNFLLYATRFSIILR